MRLAACVVFFSMPAALPAQETTGDIRGRLRSSEGRPVVGASVTATSVNLLGARQAISASDGVFLVVALPPGLYTVRITAIGHRVTIIDSVHVQLGRMQGLPETILEATSVQLSEVRIAAPGLTLDAARTTIGATLEASDFARLPADHDYKSLMAIMPHVNTSYNGDPPNSGGSTGLENMYFIDGVNVTSPLNAATGTNLPYNFVRAVEVRSGGYEAKYGRALGAIVNAVTHTGTNEFESNVFGFFTHDGIAMSPKAQPALRETGSFGYDVGARISGPVARDRLWFSAAYNPRIERADRVIQGHGMFLDRRRADVFAGKLTWQAAPDATVELTVLGDPETHHQVVDKYSGKVPLNPDPLLWRRESGGMTVSGRLVRVFGTGFRVDASAARFSGRNRSFAQTDVGAAEPLFVDHVEQSVSGGIDQPLDVRESRMTGSVHGTRSSGRHTTALGVEYDDSRTARAYRRRIIERPDTAFFVNTVDSISGTFHNVVPTAFVQDAWRATDAVTISAGVRWSRQRLTAASGGTAQDFPGEWQPRIGFSWQLGKERTQRVLGSFGRFYQQIPLQLATVFYADYFSTISLYSDDPRLPGVTPIGIISGTEYEEEWARSIDGLSTENFDEFSLGYERIVGGTARLTLRGLHRQLRSSFQMGVAGIAADTVIWVLGTPGKGDFDFLPPPTRKYTALEVSADGHWRQVRFRGSYVVSRTWGNYTGLFGSDNASFDVGVNFGLLEPHQAANSTGYLPNDRTHVAKVIASWPAMDRLTIGALFEWQSGAPLNEFGVRGPLGGPTFLVQRGTAGRTPGIWDLNIRLASDVGSNSTAKLLLDLLHVGNPRGAVRLDQQHFEGTVGQGAPPLANANYLRPLSFQPPMSARLGLEFVF